MRRRKIKVPSLAAMAAGRLATAENIVGIHGADLTFIFRCF
jgi:hypothetical protein